MKAEDILQLIKAEIKWCREHPMEEDVTAEFREGFISGLMQAEYLASRAIPNSKPRCTCGETPCTCLF